jgi:hypothetical protein
VRPVVHYHTTATSGCDRSHLTHSEALQVHKSNQITYILACSKNDSPVHVHTLYRYNNLEWPGTSNSSEALATKLLKLRSRKTTVGCALQQCVPVPELISATGFCVQLMKMK